MTPRWAYLFPPVLGVALATVCHFFSLALGASRTWPGMVLIFVLTTVQWTLFIRKARRRDRRLARRAKAAEWFCCYCAAAEGVVHGDWCSRSGEMTAPVRCEMKPDCPDADECTTREW